MQDDQKQSGTPVPKETPPAEVAKEEAPVAAPVEEEPKYHLQTLLAGAEKLFGFPHWVVEGALHHAKITGKETYTKPEVQAAVDNFVAQPDQGHVAALKAQEGT